MQSAKCKMQNAKCKIGPQHLQPSIFAFCILRFLFCIVFVATSIDALLFAA